MTYISKAKLSKQFIKHIGESNILIITVRSGEEYLHAQEVVELVDQIDPELIILTGFDSSTKDSLQLSREIKLVLKSRGKNTQILAAKDGMSLSPESYNVVLKQRTLKEFK